MTDEKRRAPQCTDCTIDQVFYCPHDRQRGYTQAIADGLAAGLPITAGMIHNGRLDQDRIDACIWQAAIAAKRMRTMIHVQHEHDASRPEWQPQRETSALLT